MGSQLTFIKQLENRKEKLQQEICNIDSILTAMRNHPEFTGLIYALNSLGYLDPTPVKF
jgi:hypothetical protein